MNIQSRFHRLLPVGACAVLLVAGLSCGGLAPPTPTPSPTATPMPTPATLPLDTVAAPAGWMSGGANSADSIGLERTDDCHTGSACLRFTYRTGEGWGGILWWPYGCDWGKANQRTCGINLLETGGFSAVERLAFWARGEQGGERIEFVVGSNPGGLPPTPRRSTGTVTLGPTWQRYEIDLRGVALTDAIALFYWGATDDENPQDAVFYLDDIQFEGIR